MRPLRDIRLNRNAALILAVVSLVATIIILAGGSSETNAQLAAQLALRHPPRSVEEIEASTPATQTANPGDTGDRGDTGSSTASASGGSGLSGASSSHAGSSSNSSSSSSSSSDSASSSGASDGSAGSSTATSTTARTTTTAPDAGLPKVGHVFLIALSTPNYKTAFGATSKAPYLRTLAKRGTVLTGYHSLARNGLADLLAMVSGQPPNQDTVEGCAKYLPYAVSATVKSSGITLGNGCIYPDAAITIADQVSAAGGTWGGYIQDEGINNCSVPGTDLALDTPLDGTQEGYDVAHNPFAFFGSLLDEGGCSEYDQDLSNFTTALAKKSTTPTFSYLGGDACVSADPVIAPSAATTTTGADTTPAATTTGTSSVAGTASSGTDPAGTGTDPAVSGTDPAGTGTDPAGTGTSTTATGTSTTATGTSTTATSTTPARLTPPAAYGCPAGEISGIAGEDAFLKTWVPKVLASAAYRDNGVLIIAFTGANGAPHAKTGALVLSRWTPKHAKIATSYTAYSLLHSMQDMLDLATLANSATAPAFAQLVLR